MEWLTPQVPQRLVGTNHENHREHLRLLSAGHVEHCWERAGNTLGTRWEHGTCDPCSALQDVRCPHPHLHVRPQRQQVTSQSVTSK